MRIYRLLLRCLRRIISRRYTVQSGTQTDYLHTRAIKRVDTSGEKIVVHYKDGTSEEIE